jgi:hypothetical protein
LKTNPVVRNDPFLFGIACRDDGVGGGVSGYLFVHISNSHQTILRKTGGNIKQSPLRFTVNLSTTKISSFGAHLLTR